MILYSLYVDKTINFLYISLGDIISINELTNEVDT